LDGLFLHRSQLRAWWDLSVLLDVPPAVAALRLQLRDGNPPRVREAALDRMTSSLALPRVSPVIGLGRMGWGEGGGEAGLSATRSVYVASI
jgi:hypothetical protein